MTSSTKMTHSQYEQYLFIDILCVQGVCDAVYLYCSCVIIITIMRQSKNEVQYNDCIFCEQDAADSIFFMMNDAIKVKYIENPKQVTTSYIDSLLRIDTPVNKEQAEAACRFREFMVLDDHDQFLKRQYKLQEYGGKITQLSEYYKFHNDIPRVVQLGVEKIMGRFYDKKRECDYKRIKKVLKAEQGLSITSVQESSSGLSDSQAVKKSRYTTLLNSISQNTLNEHSDSKILYDLCKEIEKVVPQGSDEQLNIKGSFPEDRMFEYYIKAQERKLKDRLRERNKVRQGGKVLKKFNYQQFVKSREKVSDDSKETRPRQQKEKKAEKQAKFVYNTNIKIQIRNAMFYSEGQPPLQMGNLQYDNNKDNRFKKKAAPVPNNANPYRSNQKLAADIYKSSQHDLRLRNYAALANQRLTTKENVNLSRSKQKRKSSSKQLQTSKKSLHTLSARKLLLHANDWMITSKPARSLSTSTIKKRSTSTGLGSASTKRLQRGSMEKRAVEGISRYGSSEYRPVIMGKDGRSVSIKDLLSRKLKFNI